jgi:hypothetical protein
MLGDERDEVVGKIRCPDLLTPESKLKFCDNFPKFQEQGFIKDLKLDLVRKDGSICPVSLSAMMKRTMG